MLPENSTPPESVESHIPFPRRVLATIKASWELLILPAAVLAFFWNIIVGKRYFWEDIVEQFYPMRSFLVNSLRHFQLPYWSPYVFSGFPFINDVQTQTFYPLNWPLVFCIRPDGRLIFLALELQVILHVLIAGYLMFLLAREWDLSRRASIFAGLSFMLSGFMIVNTIHVVVVFTIAWFPLVLLLFHRSLYTRRIYLALAAGLVFGLAALAGYPQTLMHMGYGLALYALFYIILKWRDWHAETVWRAVLGLMLIALVGVGVAAVQYLPSTMYLKYTLRSALTHDQLVDGSVPPVQLLRLLVPKFFGSMSGKVVGTLSRTDTVVFWGGFYDYYYWETVIYLGVIPLILAFLALFDRRRPIRWFAVTLAVIALVLALGKFTPVYNLALAILPGLGRFRIPGRMAGLFTFAMILLAASGMDSFLASGSERRVRVLLRVMLIAAATFLLIWLLFLTGALSKLVSQFSITGVYANIVRQSGLFVALLLIWLAIVFARTRKRFLPAAGFWLIMAATFVDLFLFGSRFNASSVNPDDRPFQKGPAIEYLQRESRKAPFRVNMRVGPELLLGRDQGNLDRFELIEGYTPLGLARYAPFTAPDQVILDLLNVKYKFDSLGRGLVLNRSYLPRARMVYRYDVVSSDSAALKIVREIDFDYRHVAILERAPGFPSGEEDEVPNQVTITRREANFMQLSVQTVEPGILVLSEVYYPEWKARLDGKPVEIYPADYVLRGITVPSGSHTIEMYFDGRWVKLGGAISLLTLMVAIGLIVVWRHRDRIEPTAGEIGRNPTRGA